MQVKKSKHRSVLSKITPKVFLKLIVFIAVITAMVAGLLYSGGFDLRQQASGGANCSCSQYNSSFQSCLTTPGCNPVVTQPGNVFQKCNGQIDNCTSGGSTQVCQPNTQSNQGCGAYGCPSNTKRVCTCNAQGSAWACNCIADSSCQATGGGSGGGNTGSGSTPPSNTSTELFSDSFENGTGRWQKSSAMSNLITFSCQQYGPCNHGSKYLKVSRQSLQDGNVATGDGTVTSDWIETGANVTGKTFKISFAVKSHIENQNADIQLQRYPNFSSNDPWKDTTISKSFSMSSDKWYSRSGNYTFTNPSNGNNSSKVRIIIRPQSGPSGGYVTGSS